MSRFHVVVPAFLICPLLACGGPSPEEAARQAEEASKAAMMGIEQAAGEWTAAFKAEDGTALAALYDPDAVLLPPNEPSVIGSDAIAGWNDEMFAEVDVVGAELKTLELETSGDFAYRQGSYSMELAVGDDTVRSVGKFMEIWKKQPDGSWKISHDIWNENTPAAPPPE